MREISDRGTQIINCCDTDEALKYSTQTRQNQKDLTLYWISNTVRELKQKIFSAEEYDISMRESYEQFEYRRMLGLSDCCVIPPKYQNKQKIISFDQCDADEPEQCFEQRSFASITNTRLYATNDYNISCDPPTKINPKIKHNTKKSFGNKIKNGILKIKLRQSRANK